MGAGPAMPMRDEVGRFFAPKGGNFPEHEGLEGKSFYGMVRHAERICMVEEFNPVKWPQWTTKQDPILSSYG